jgi:molybdopterin-dependent oxidoreductase alpha subunit
VAYGWGMVAEQRGVAPQELTGDLKITSPHGAAAGVAAVANSFRVTLRAAGTHAAGLLAKVNQHDGFDCPSCAWPDPEHRSVAEFCENGAKAVADAATSARVTPEWLAGFTLDELAAKTDKWLNDAGRLTAPVVKRSGSERYEAIGWDEAFSMVGRRLAALADPNRAAFYTSGRASNEAAFLYQLFVREYGTNNLPDCSNMCHESSGAALSSTIGVGKGTVTLADVEAADLVVVIGQNPGTNAPRMLTSLQRVAERGGTIVSINPMREQGLVKVRNPQDFAKPWRWGHAVTGQVLASMFVPVRVGGDLALLLGVQKALVELDRAGEQAIDHDFVDARTGGIDDVVAAVDAADWMSLEAASGIDRTQIRELAALLAVNTKIVWCWAMGLTQHVRAVDTIRQIVNLALMRGAIGKPGAGLCPVRGHSNVQGDRTVGIWDKPSAAFLDRLGSAVGFDPPREHGYDVVETIRAMHRGDIDVFVSLGGNLLSAGPDTGYTAAGFERVGLTVSIATKLNRSHLVTGNEALILPCLARTDRDDTGRGGQFVTCESSMGVVAMSRGQLAPPTPEVRSEPAIVAGLATATLGDASTVDWLHLTDDYDRVRDLIEAAVAGFDRYNERVRRRNGIELPNAARRGDFSGLPGSRARFTAVAWTGEPDPLPDDALVMMTVRSHDQFNTTVYESDDRYRGIHGERRVVFVNPDDAAERGLAAEDVVDIVGVADDRARVAERFQVVPYDLPLGCCATYFPEANVLVPVDVVARESNTPASKAVAVRLVPRA